MVTNIMEEKKKYVVTETRVNTKCMYVETFIKCITEELEIAKDVLNSLREVLMKLGYDENNFFISDYGWTYKHVCGIIKAEIHLSSYV